MFNRKIKTFKDVAEYQLCSGCGVCAYLYPDKYEIKDVARFGKRPILRAGNPSADEHLEDVCPGVKVAHSEEALHQPGLIEELLDGWGPILGLWEVSATDPEIRHKGSSGGAISALALYCLEKEGVAGALQVSSDTEKPYINRNVFSRSRDDILAATGSRYSPASPCEDLDLIENAEAPSVFVGKPCDVLGTNNAVTLKPELKEKLGLTIACFCAGSPSTDGTLKLLSEMGVKDPGAVKVLRYRGHGWPGSATVEYSEGDTTKKVELTYDEAWGDLLQKHRQWRCYICPDHTGEFADISVGDPWYREIKQGEKGTSLVLARTVKGREIIRKALEGGYLVGQMVAPEVLPQSQPNLLKARGALWGRLVTLRFTMAPCPQYSNMIFSPFWLSELSLREKVQSILGTVKRLFVKKLKTKHVSSFTCEGDE